VLRGFRVTGVSANQYRCYFYTTILQNTIRGRSPAGQIINLIFHMKGIIKQIKSKKDELTIGSAILVFTFIVEFARFIMHH
jgi:hypothetical protein